MPRDRRGSRSAPVQYRIFMFPLHLTRSKVAKSVAVGRNHALCLSRWRSLGAGRPASARKAHAYLPASGSNSAPAAGGARRSACRIRFQSGLVFLLLQRTAACGVRRVGNTFGGSALPHSRAPAALPFAGRRISCSRHFHPLDRNSASCIAGRQLDVHIDDYEAAPFS